MGAWRFFNRASQKNNFRDIGYINNIFNRLNIFCRIVFTKKQLLLFWHNISFTWLYLDDYIRMEKVCQ